MSSNQHIEPMTVVEGEAPAPTLSVLDLVLLRVKLRANRRRLWLRYLLDADRGEGGDANYHRLIEDILEGRDNLVDESEWQQAQPDLVAPNADLMWAEGELDADQGSRLAGLVQNFGLTADEVSVLHCCLALALEPQLERVYSYLQDHNGRGYTTLPLVSKLFGLPYQISSAGLQTLKTWRFVRETAGGKGEPALYEIDPWVCNWLRGHNKLDPMLIGRASFPAEHAPLDHWPLEDTVSQVNRMLEANPFQKLRVSIRAVDGSGRQSLACLVARAFDLPLMVIDTDRLAPEDWPQIYLHAQRQAYMGGFAVGWRGDELAERQWPLEVLPVQLQFAMLMPEQVLQPQQGVLDLRVNLKPLPIAIRRALWDSLVPTTADWDVDALEHLVMRYPTTVGQIALVGRRAPSHPGEAVEILREGNRHRLGKLAQLMPANFDWSDLSLPPYLLESLQDFVFEAKEREQWWEGKAAGRLFPQGKGLMALFSGPSGTGKTMTAQVIAANLQQDLFRIDLSNVISKYVGETSKHIDRILTQAQSMHAVLLFDEADTLFGKRTEIKDAHDRFANADTNYLLQAIESYPGVAILATNRKSSIDGAFLRRLRFCYEFSRPDAAQRLQLWMQLISEIVGAPEAGLMREGLRQLAQMLDLTGAQIKYAVLSAVFVARREGRPLQLSHLLKGVERELAKEGKGLSPETSRRMETFRQ